VRNEELLQRFKEVRNILHTIKRRKADWIGHILHRNCHLRHVVERKIEGVIAVTGRRGGKRELLLDVLKEIIGYEDMEIKRGCTRQHSVLWKRLWKCSMAGNRMSQ
jgi:hypothetical protein